MTYQPKTGAKCGCKPGIQRDNCPACEGTGWQIDFAAIRNRPLNALRYHVTGAIERGEKEPIIGVTNGK